jgi:hypothetical protein
MTNQIQIHAYEPRPNILSKLAKLALPQQFMEKIYSYIERNIFLKLIKDKSQAIEICCPACLKAHIKKTAVEVKLPSEVSRKVFNITNGNAGHMGYYLDKDKLIKFD